ncbi:MAG: type II toxin-antitoxin system HicA family toxin [Candidatus Bipolaricaulota bacterium]|nr:type II toxin-antitoxin system HicA family toxin [Candidatus Bipolaricaulota bacterium]
MSRKRPQLRGEQIVRLLERLGYQQVGKKGGSHRKLRTVISGREHNITVPVHTRITEPTKKLRKARNEPSSVPSVGVLCLP